MGDHHGRVGRALVAVLLGRHGAAGTCSRFCVLETVHLSEAAVAEGIRNHHGDELRFRALSAAKLPLVCNPTCQITQMAEFRIFWAFFLPRSLCSASKLCT